jgi:predicted ATPase
VVTFLATAAAGGAEPRHAPSDRTGSSRHREVARRAMTSNGGHTFDAVGTGSCGAFANPLDAVRAAIEFQRAVAASPVDGGAEAMAPAGVVLHSGVAERHDGAYVGPPLLRVTRLLAAAHGGQVLLSAAVVDLLGDVLPAPVQLRSLGTHRLADLGPAEKVHQLVAPGLPDEFPPLQTSEVRRHNLPAELSSFVGRERELYDVKRALGESRLVTLTGVGGSGKSRLALQAAADLVDDFPDGAALVELAALREPERIPAAVAAGLDIVEDPRRPVTETLIRELASRRLLVVVDNCEHLLAACADLVETLLRAAPGLHVLATSREALAVTGEVIVPVPSLGIPPADTEVSDLEAFPAVRLFTDRARAVRASFSITPANAPAVVDVITHLDGIPLAIELAASRVKLLSVEQIASRLSDRFRLLSGGPRTAQPRQRTLRAALDWSFDLLSEDEQTLLRRLSVFMGSCTADAATVVCGGDGVVAMDVLDLLGSLVDKSLVFVVEGGSENRYGLLETVRQYGVERLAEAGEEAATRAAHRDWCRSLVEAAAVHVQGGEGQAVWLGLLEAEHDNIQAALEWSLTLDDAVAALRSAVGSAWFWYLRGHWDVARRWLEKGIAVDGAEPALRARAGAWAAVFAWRRGDLARAEELARTSLQTLEGSGDEGEGLGLLALALVALSRVEHDSADGYTRRALGVFRAQQHSWGVTTSLLVLAHVAANRRSGDVAGLLEESSALLSAGGDAWGRARVLNLRGQQALRALELDLAEDLLEASRALAVELGDRASQAESLLPLGHVHLLRREDQEAAGVLGENRSIVEELRDAHDLVHADQALALLALARGHVAEGEALLGDTAARIARMGRAAMGSAYAMGLSDIYRRGGRPALAAALLRHALWLLDAGQNPAEYDAARKQLAALEAIAADETRTAPTTLSAVPQQGLDQP